MLHTLGVYTLGVYTLEQRILDLEEHLPACSTLWGSILRVSSLGVYRARATDFGSGAVLIRLGVYRLGV